MRPSKNARVVVVALFVSTLSAAAEGAYFLSATGGAGMPLGADSSLFSVATGGSLEGGFVLMQSPRILVGPGLSYTSSPLKSSGTLQTIEAHAGVELAFELLPRFTAGAFAAAGGYFATMDDLTALNPYVGGGLGLGFRIAGPVGLRAAIGYRNYFGLYSDFSFAGGISVSFGGTGTKAAPAVKEKPAAEPKIKLLTGSAVLIDTPQLNPVFPVFFKHYDDNPFGAVVVRNSTKTPITNCSVEFFVKQYMDNPKPCTVPFDLAPGEEKTVDLLALFTSAILDVTEGTKVSGTITLSYKQGEKQARVERVETLTVMDRNALVWDDDRRAAAFITAKDPAVMRFARVFSSLTAESNRYGLPPGMLAAISMHEALAAYGIKYIRDPASGYESLSQSKEAVDFMQFPSQTLAYKGGDCDDLSVLYCALLQALGYDTALITVPGHIYAAVDLGMDPAIARKRFSRADEFILENGRSWLPIEVTMVNPGFLNCWQEGAREWRESASKGFAKLYPVQEAWKTFVPVGFSGGKDELSLPSEEKVRAEGTAEMVKLIDREIFAQVASIQAEIKKEQNAPRALNKLGVLYARYGLYDRAKAQFEQACAEEDFVPSLVNLGNLAYLGKDMAGALASFQKAYAKEPGNASVLLALARTNHELENYGNARELYETLKTADPLLAARFSYLDLRGQEATRAADGAGLTGTVEWAE